MAAAQRQRKLPVLGPDLFKERLRDTCTMEEVSKVVLGILKDVREAGAERIGYVSGMISSDGPGFVERNIKRLAGYAEVIRGREHFPVFSPTDVLFNELYVRLKHETEPRWYWFWETILSGGQVTDVFFTPRWESSLGARDEERVARKIGLNRHYLENDPLLLSIKDAVRR